MNKTDEMHRKIKELRDELKTNSSEIEDLKAAALIETSAEVLGGLEEAFDHYLHKSESAWK